ncbi:MAG: FAD binding domain-containing protein [Pseudomonadota bacterium]
MKPSPFAYHAPTTLAETLDLLADLDDAKLLAGGQSLMPMMNFRYVAPEHLIDLNQVAGLDRIELGEKYVRLGAMVRQRSLLTHDALNACCPLFREALEWVGHIATRNRGTLGGSLSHLDPAAELPVVCMALNAEVEIASSEGQRTVQATQWPVAYMLPNIDEHELLIGIRFARPDTSFGARTGMAFSEFARRHGDFALAAVAIVVALDDDDTVTHASVALGGVDDVPLRLSAAEELLIGRRADAGVVTTAARAALELPGFEDVHASATYRRKVAMTLLERTLSTALMRARESQT